MYYNIKFVENEVFSFSLAVVSMASSKLKIKPKPLQSLNVSVHQTSNLHEKKKKYRNHFMVIFMILFAIMLLRLLAVRKHQKTKPNIKKKKPLI